MNDFPRMFMEVYLPQPFPHTMCAFKFCKNCKTLYKCIYYNYKLFGTICNISKWAVNVYYTCSGNVHVLKGRIMKIHYRM